MKSYYIYALESLQDGRVYVGFTSDVNRRIREHNNGKTKSTKGYRPWRLFFKKLAGSRLEARKLEKYYKSGCGKEYLKKVLKAP
ncbi:MAG: GIY-YIG nuclease family protein [Bacteroidales bacterium]|nr:GIY-YIG nuclease family protein [Bacteroidales bacterium]MCF8388519.1 GIY-YIG nuclease family protein [Bacteroidales bacterium]MCF8399529.1 GIY-YIG nuclease family protein [Bacteroidales bacterium]